VPHPCPIALAKLTLEKYFRDDDGNEKPWLFPQLLGIAKRWLTECVILKDNAFLQMLLLLEFAHDAADRIYKAIVASTDSLQSMFQDFTLRIEGLLGRWRNRDVSSLGKNQSKSLQTIVFISTLFGQSYHSASGQQTIRHVFH
jgi:hypothetical protein